MSAFRCNFDSIDHMVISYPDWWTAAGARSAWNKHDHVFVEIAPGDMTVYRIGLIQSFEPDFVGLSFYSPYNRAAVVPTYGDPAYIASKLRFTDDELRYPGLTDILTTVLRVLRID
ncbi:MAG: hypothetical protein IT195_12500 [Microthrixaceae bacterium]|nr:hypothetical protein [Microthrixaceae bacterium]